MTRSRKEKEMGKKRYKNVVIFLYCKAMKKDEEEHKYLASLLTLKEELEKLYNEITENILKSKTGKSSSLDCFDDKSLHRTRSRKIDLT